MKESSWICESRKEYEVYFVRVVVNNRWRVLFWMVIFFMAIAFTSTGVGVFIQFMLYRVDR
jgi:hypothetical protein